jgi:uncharacterized protein (TIRG00374 family)
MDGRRKTIQLLVGLLLSGIALVLVIQGLDWGVLSDTIRQVRLGWLVAAVAVEMLSLLVNAVRWRWLYWPHHRPSTGRLFWILNVAQLANTVLPGRLGLLVRTVMPGGESGTSRATTVTALAVEKLIEGLTLLPLGVLLSLSLDLPAWLRISAIYTGGMLLALLLLLGAGLRWRDRIEDRIARHWGGRPASLVGRLLDGLDALRSARAGGRIWVWSLVYWGLLAVINFLVIQAVGLSLPGLASLALLFVLQIGVRVPSSPGNVGVFDYLGVVTLALFGVERSTALAVTLLLHLVTYIPPSLVGAAYLWWANAWSELAGQLAGRKA